MPLPQACFPALNNSLEHDNGLVRNVTESQVVTTSTQLDIDVCLVALCG
jgi:hypothetical protein